MSTAPLSVKNEIKRLEHEASRMTGKSLTLSELVHSIETDPRLKSLRRRIKVAAYMVGAEKKP